MKKSTNHSGQQCNIPPFLSLNDFSQKRTTVNSNVSVLTHIIPQPSLDQVSSRNKTARELSIFEIKLAAERIKPYIVRTPLCLSKYAKSIGYDVYLKCENSQLTGSCSERGVLNALLAYRNSAMSRGIIVPSRGNTALAAAYHGANLGIPITVALPDRVAESVVKRCAEYGADVVICGKTLDETILYAQRAHKEKGLILLSPNDPLILAGLGTVGLEILAQMPDVEVVVVPAGSGSLLAPVLIACKKLKCSCMVYGVESASMPKMGKAIKAGMPVALPMVSSGTDGMALTSVCPMAFDLLNGRIDRMISVDEEFIAKATVASLERERMVVDGSGVCVIGALMQGLMPELQGKRVVCVISGGNVDCSRLYKVLQGSFGAKKENNTGIYRMP